MSDISKDIVDNIANSVIKESTIHGLGLFSTADIKKDTIICLLDGQYVPANTFFYNIFEWNAVSQDTLLIRPCRTKYSFINHSRSPNVGIVLYPLRIVTLVDIACGEEFTLDYRKEQLSPEYLAGHGATYL